MSYNQNRGRHIADAFLYIAKANHYMVGFTGDVTLEELEVAKQFLIARGVAYSDKDKPTEFALDLIEVWIRKVMKEKGY